MKIPKHTLAILMLVLAHVLWGVNTPAIKLAVETIPVPVFLVFRYVIIIAILLPLAIRYWQPMRRQDVLRQTIVSLCWAAGVFIGSVGLTMTSVSHAAVLEVAQPMILLLFAFVFLREKIGFKSVVGIVIACIGALVIIGYQPAGGSTDQLLGDMLIILGVVFSVVGTLLFKPITKRYNPFQSIAIGSSIGIVPTALYVATSTDTVQLGDVSLQSIFGLVLSALAMLAANILFFYALRAKKVSEVSLYYYIQPVVGVCIAWLFLHEALTLPYIVGVSLVALGIYVAEKKRRARSQ